MLIWLSSVRQFGAQNSMAPWKCLHTSVKANQLTPLPSILRLGKSLNATLGSAVVNYVATPFLSVKLFEPISTKYRIWSAMKLWIWWYVPWGSRVQTGLLLDRGCGVAAAVGFLLLPFKINTMTDLTKWRLYVKEGRQIWNYFPNSTDVQSFVDKYLLGIDVVRNSCNFV